MSTTPQRGVAVVGVGAIGSVIASSLMEAGHHPILCVRSTFDTLSVSSPEGDTSYSEFSCRTSPDGLSPVDMLVVATKVHQTASAQAWFQALVDQDTVVLVVQNGVEHRATVAPFVPEETEIAAGIIDVPASRRRPGDIEVSRSGTLSLPDDAAGRAARRWLGETRILTKIEARSDFAEVMWRKLAVNVISGSVPALTDRSAGVFREPEIEAMCRQLIRESLAVAAASGVSLPSHTEDDIIRGFRAADPNALGSMLKDRRAGRTLEADARNGAVARLGRRLGVDTPYNAAVAALAGAVNRA